MLELASGKEFDDFVAKHKYVAIDFYATWCGPCERLAPDLVKLEKEFPKVEFAKVNVDTPDMKVVVEAVHVISYMPTVVLMHDGVVKAKIEDNCTARTIRAELVKMLTP
jgi:thioredoxin 1